MDETRSLTRDLFLQNARLAALKPKKRLFSCVTDETRNSTRQSTQNIVEHRRYSPRGLDQNCCFLSLIQHILGSSMCVHIAVIKELFQCVYFQSLRKEVNQLNNTTVNAHACASEDAKGLETYPTWKTRLTSINIYR